MMNHRCLTVPEQLCSILLSSVISIWKKRKRSTFGCRRNSRKNLLMRRTKSEDL